MREQGDERISSFQTKKLAGCPLLKISWRVCRILVWAFVVVEKAG
jgi:hypothetical protein